MSSARTRTRQRIPSHRRRERPKPSRRSAILLSLAILLALLAIPAVGYYQVFIAPLREPVIRVNDTTFDMGYYIERLRILNQQNTLFNLPTDLSTTPFALLDTLRDDELIRQYALAYNINVTREQIDRALRERLQPPQQEGEQASQEELDREFQELYRQRLADLKVSDQEYRTIIRASLMREVMKERLSDRVPTVAEQVRARAIAVQDEQQVAEVQQRLKDGEDFGAVARALSLDEESRREGGDLGWLPRRVMDSPFDDYVFQLDIGAVSEPFQLSLSLDPQRRDWLWLVQVAERAEARVIEPQAREKLTDRALEDWLEEQRKANVVESFFNSDRYEFAIRKIGEYDAKRPQAASGS